MGANGQNYVMLTSSSSPFPEVDDIGLGCGPSFNPTSVTETRIISTSFALHQNYPNPFNPSTTIEYVLPRSGFISLKVSNLLGQHIATLVNEHQDAGFHKISWNADGHPSGVYYYRIETEALTTSKKLIFVH